MAAGPWELEAYESGNATVYDRYSRVRSRPNAPSGLVDPSTYTAFQTPLASPAESQYYPYSNMIVKTATGSRAWMRPGADGLQRYWELTSISPQFHAKFYRYLPYGKGSVSANIGGVVGDYIGVYMWPSTRSINSGGRINHIQVKQGFSYNTNAGGYATGGGDSEPIFEICAMRRSEAGGTGTGPRAVFRHYLDYSGQRGPEDQSYHGSGGGAYAASPRDIPLDTPYALKLSIGQNGVRPWYGQVTYNPFSVTWFALTAAEVPYSHTGGDVAGYAMGATGRSSFLIGFGNYSDRLGTLDLLTAQHGYSELLAPWAQRSGVIVTPPPTVTPAKNFITQDIGQVFGDASGVVVNRKTGTQALDLEIATIWWNGADKNQPDPPVGSNWKFVGKTIRVGSSTHAGVWTRIAQATDPTTSTFTFSETTLGSVSISHVKVLRGYTGVESSTFNKGTSTTPTGIAVTTLGIDRALIFETVLETTGEPTDPATGMNERLDNGGWIINDQNVSTAGSTQNRTLLASLGTSQGWTSIMLSLAPGTPAPPTSVLTAPSNLSATTSPASISLSWTAGQGATAYNVFRTQTSGSYSSTPIGTSTTPTFTDSTAAVNTTYFYRVTSTSGSNQSAPSNEIAARIVEVVTPPDPDPGTEPPPPGPIVTPPAPVPGPAAGGAGDRFRIVRRVNGVMSVLADLENGSTYRKLKETFTVTAPAKRPKTATNQRRYAGTTVIYETHENASVSARWLIRGDTPDEARRNVEALLQLTDDTRTSQFIEVRFDSTTSSVFYERRGPASWEWTYRWAQFKGANSFEATITFPVAPLAEGPPMRVLDTFVTNTLSDYGYNQGGTFAVAGGQLVPTDTSRQRLHHGAYRYTDSEVTVRYVVGATRTGGEVCAVLKEIDTQNRIEVAVSDNGTTSRWDVFLVNDGVRSLFFGESLTTRLNVSGTYWLKARIEGSQVALEHHVTSPNVLSTPAQLRHENDSLPAKWGPSVAGSNGFSLTAPDTGWRIDEFRIDPWVRKGIVETPTPPLGIATPAVLDLYGIPGTAPAKVDMEITTPGSAGATWALIAWTRRPTSVAVSPYPPFGLFQDTTAVDITGLSTASGAAWNDNSGRSVTTSGAGTGGLSWRIKPSLVSQDDFGRGDLDVEVWARVQVNANLISPRAILSVLPETAGYGAPQYSQEFGSVGTSLVGIQGSETYVLARLGTVTVRPDSDAEVFLRVDITWLAGSSGLIGIDYVVAVPARRRAALPTGKTPDSAYPAFQTGLLATTRAIAYDLTSTIARPGQAPLRSGGFGGAALEVEPDADGDAQMVVWVSNVVPDDGVPAPASAYSFLRCAITANVTPRYRLMGQ